MTPEMIQAIFAGIVTLAVAVIGAVMAGHQKKIAELTARVAELETQIEEERGKFKESVRVIRAFRRFVDELILMLRADGKEPPESPVVIPPELEDEL